jgi:hypothetical protein
VSIERGEVRLIESSSALDFSLSSVISMLGEPEYVQASIAKGPDGELAILEVYYPTKGIAFVLWPDQSRPGMVEPWTRVRRVQYFAPSDLASYVKVSSACLWGLEAGNEWVAEQLRLYQPWQGYGQMRLTETE